MRFAGFIGPSYQLQSINVDCQRCVNLYPEMNELGSGKEREVASLRATPGLKRLATIGLGPIRATYFSSTGQFFVVSGNTLYSVTSSWVASSLGTLSSSAGPVSVADNGLQVMLVDGISGYYVTLSDMSFHEITDPAFSAADQVVYQDGYFIFNITGTGKFGITGLNDITVDALDVATAEGNPDVINAVVSDHRDLWLFGPQSIEVFYDSGNADFPFERIQGTFIELGCHAPFSAIKLNNTVFWLGGTDKGSGQVYMAQGYQPQRISTHAVESAIQRYSVISDAVAYAYQSEGHNFYVLNFPTASATWVYDLSTSLWHERAYLIDGTFIRHRASCHAYAFDKHVVGDFEDGRIFELSSSTYDDDGAAIRRERITPHMSQDMTRNFYSLFQLDIETGVGADGAAQGSDPQIMLAYSDDGGHSWLPERWVSFGKIGNRKARAIWRRLGSSRDRVFKVACSEPVKITFIGAEIQVLQGAS